MFMSLLYLILLFVIPVILSFVTRKNYKEIFKHLLIVTTISLIITYGLLFFMNKSLYYVIPIISIGIYLILLILTLKKVYNFHYLIAIIPSFLIVIGMGLFIFNTKNISNVNKIYIDINKDFSDSNDHNINKYIALIKNNDNKTINLKIVSDNNFEVIKPNKAIILKPNQEVRLNIFVHKKSKNTITYYNLYFESNNYKIKRRVSFENKE